MLSKEQLLKYQVKIDEYKAKESLLQDPVAICRQHFGFDPNQGQSNFLVDIKNPSILGYLIQTLRGGGKTIVCAAANCIAANEFDVFKSLILSGSFEQAKTFYSYVKFFIDHWPDLQRKLDGPPLQSETRFKDGGFIKCLTASEKSGRSPHVDWLFIDEFVLVKRDLINAAFPTVRTSKRPKRIFLTTASQTQACISIDLWYDFWDNANDIGFRTYQWAIDDCPWIDMRDLELARGILDPVIFETEYLGLRAEHTGAVFKRSQIDLAVTTSNHFKYSKELPCVAGVDWGVVHPTVCTVVQPQGEYVFVVEVVGRSGQDIMEWTFELQKLRAKYNIERFMCDASHKFNNLQLKNLAEPVTEIPFSRDKETMIGEVRRELEHKLLKIPPEFKDTIKQMKRYTYDPDTKKPIKMADDYVDSLMLACWGANMPSFTMGDFFGE